MAYREVTMLEIRELLRQVFAGVGKKRVGKQLGVDSKTVRRYVALAGEHGITDEATLTDERMTALMVALSSGGRPRGDSWQACVEQREAIAELIDAGVRLTKVRKLLVRRGVTVPYSTLHRFAVQELEFGRRTLTMPVVDGEPGVELELDLGWLPQTVADARGRLRRLRVWIFTPSCSRYRFIHPCLEESTKSAIEACEAAWAFYDGVFGVIVVDNTKALIAQPDATQPKIADGFLDYAQTRGFLVDAARVRRPTDKARVERSVRYVRDDAFGGEIIRDLTHAREHGRWWCEHDAGMRRHRLTQRMPKEHFFSVEHALLKPAPTTPYDVPHWCEPKVARDQHAQVLKALYSLPRQYVGKRLRVRADSQTVRFYDRGVLVKVHPRCAASERATDTSDFDAHRAAAACRDTDFLVAQAKQHGEHVERFARALLDVPLPWTRMRRVYALLALAKRYGARSLDAACELALIVDMHDVKRLARMLEHGVPKQLDLPVVRSVAPSRYLRAASDYALSSTDHCQGEDR